MTPAPPSNPNSIWREAFRIPRRYFNDIVPALLVSFALVTLVAYFASGIFIEFIESLDKTKNKMPNLAALLGLVPAYLLLIIVMSVQWFYLVITFSKRELKVGQPLLHVGRYFYAIGMRLLTLIMIFGVMFAGAMISASVGAILGHSVVGGLISGLVMGASYLAYYFLIIKFILVSFLAANNIKPPLDIGWKLTDGNWWRLLGTLLVVSLIVYLMLIPLILVGTLIGVAVGHDGGISIMRPLASLGLSFVASVFVLIYAAYQCAASRILIDEKRQLDPSFLRAS